MEGVYLFVGFFKIHSTATFTAFLSYHIQSISKQLHTEIKMIFPVIYRCRKLSAKFYFQTFLVNFVLTVLQTICKYYRTLKAIFLNNGQNYNHSVDLYLITQLNSGHKNSLATLKYQLLNLISS